VRVRIHKTSIPSPVQRVGRGRRRAAFPGQGQHGIQADNTFQIQPKGIADQRQFGRFGRKVTPGHRAHQSVPAAGRKRQFGQMRRQRNHARHLGPHWRSAQHHHEHERQQPQADHPRWESPFLKPES